MRAFSSAVLVASVLVLAGCSDGPTDPSAPAQAVTVAHFLPSHSALRAKLREIQNQVNGGLGFDMWATILDRDGRVVDVVFTGGDRDDQWPGSRVISAQKANTANAFRSIPPSPTAARLRTSAPGTTS